LRHAYRIERRGQSFERQDRDVQVGFAPHQVDAVGEGEGQIHRLPAQHGAGGIDGGQSAWIERDGHGLDHAGKLKGRRVDRIARAVARAQVQCVAQQVVQRAARQLLLEQRFEKATGRLRGLERVGKAQCGNLQPHAHDVAHVVGSVTVASISRRYRSVAGHQRLMCTVTAV